MKVLNVLPVKKIIVFSIVLVALLLIVSAANNSAEPVTTENNIKCSDDTKLDSCNTQSQKCEYVEKQVLINGGFEI